MNKLFNEDGHISDYTVCRLKKEMLSDDELIKVLGHISECMECAEVLAGSYDNSELEEIPEGFEESIKLNMKDDRNKKFKFYCIKVVAAASIAICMLFSNAFNYIAGRSLNKIKAPDYEKSVATCSQLNSLADRIMSMEVFK
ncbi:hypothetical protein [uncultured Clostridium sp.]|uniref:hypothetical protein n=1 Tax=uncultured Clostridium sp. TaxID=59620 RepID=UPI0025DFC712|nr:hypothetical protein [uncultured Clostridium sp.]